MILEFKFTVDTAKYPMCSETEIKKAIKNLITNTELTVYNKNAEVLLSTPWAENIQVNQA